LGGEPENLLRVHLVHQRTNRFGVLGHRQRWRTRGCADVVSLSGLAPFTRGLLVAEIALACTLLVGATLLVRSFINLTSVDRGLDASGVITAWIGFDRPAFRDPTARLLTARAVEERIRQLPGVTTAFSLR
jgi:hypothetical protein